MTKMKAATKWKVPMKKRPIRRMNVVRKRRAVTKKKVLTERKVTRKIKVEKSRVFYMQTLRVLYYDGATFSLPCLNTGDQSTRKAHSVKQLSFYDG